MVIDIWEGRWRLRRATWRGRAVAVLASVDSSFHVYEFSIQLKRVPQAEPGAIARHYDTISVDLLALTGISVGRRLSCQPCKGGYAPVARVGI